MNARAFSFLAILLLWGGGASAQSAGPSTAVDGVRTFHVAREAAAAAPLVRKGRFKVVISLQVLPEIPDGTQLFVYVWASYFDKTYSDYSEVNGIYATVSGHEATATVNIPYSWLVASATGEVTIEANIYGGSLEATLEHAGHSILGRVINLPADGAITVVKLGGGI